MQSKPNHLTWEKAELWDPVRASLKQTNKLSCTNSVLERKVCIYADVGDIRLSLKQTHRETNNKWRLYLSIRTHKANGVAEDLKHGICVAEYGCKLSQEQAIQKAEEYVAAFVVSIISDWSK